MELKDNVALVTGASGGLGRQICLSLANAGANLAVAYNSRHGEAQVTARKVRDIGVESEPLRCDLTDRQQVESLVSQTMERFGRVDILVNNAVYNKWIPFNDLEALTFEEWEKITSINLTGPMLLTKAVAGPMRRQGAGRIVNIASMAGLAPSGSSIAYAVSKAGLIHLTRCMAVALGPEVLVNCIAPGLLEGTRMAANLDPEHKRRAKETAALKRAVDLDDVADQVVAFCRTDSTTGQTLVMDAGRFYH